MFANAIHNSWYDDSQSDIRKKVGKLSGVSKGTLERLDHVGRPTKNGAQPADREAEVLYNTFLTQALVEHLASKDSGAKKRTQSKKS